MANTRDIASICERLAEVCAPKSIRIRLEILQSNDTVHGRRCPEFPLKEEWAATSSGLRYYDYWCMPPDEPFTHMSVYSDGPKFAHVWYQRQDAARQAQISIDKTELVERRDFFLHAPWPIRVTHVGLVRLDDALPGAEVMADADVIGRGCDVFHFKNAGKQSSPQSLVYFLDKSTAYPLKVVAYDNPERIREQKPNWAWEAKSFDRVAGQHYLPLSSTYNTYLNSLDPAHPKFDLSQSIKIVHAEFDTAIPRSDFWFVAEKGVPVADSTLPRLSSARTKPTTPLQTGNPVDPIRADLSRDNGSMLRATGLALSLAVLLIAFVLWKRTR